MVCSVELGTGQVQILGACDGVDPNAERMDRSSTLPPTPRPPHTLHTIIQTL